MKGKLTRSSTCGSLRFPPNLCCVECEPSITRALQKGTQPKSIKKCHRPWLPKWGNHREIEKVMVFKKANAFLGIDIDEGDILIDTYLYKESNGNIVKELVTNTPPVNSAANESQVEILECTIPPIILPPSQEIHNESSITSDNNNNFLQSQSQSESESQTDSFQDKNRRSVSTGKDAFLKEIICRSNKQDVTVTIPTTHELVHVSHLARLEAKAKNYDKLMRELSRKKYKGSKMGDAMLGLGASLIPQAGYAGYASVIPFVVGNIFQNAGVPIDTTKIVMSSPSKEKIRKCVTENAVDTILLIQASLKMNNHVYISSDKGNKKGNKNLAKFICWYDVKLNEVKKFLLDVDCTDENTKDITDAIVHALRRTFSSGTAIVIRGQCTDSGGGGTKAALARSLAARNLSHPNYLVGTCSLHNLQTGLRNAVESVLGEGGQNNEGEYVMNVMQLLHGAYNIQNWQETEELKELWTYVQQEEIAHELFKKLEEPVLTRWWLVGACASSFKAHIGTWTKICRAIRNSAKSGSASSKIASCTLNLIHNKCIINDLHLLVGFHEFFLNTHFNFFQEADPMVANSTSFIARHVTVRFFLMDQDIMKIENEYDNISHFMIIRDH